MKPRAHATDGTGGFTLVEALVSVFVLSLALVAITSLLTRSLQATLTGQNYLVASKLALEGFEMVRVKRNNNLIARANPATPDARWDDNLIGNWSMVSSDSSALAYGNSFRASSNSALHVYTSGTNSGKYTYTSGGNTKVVPGNFTRTVRVTRNQASAPYYSATVTSTVTWNENGSTRTLQLSSVLYDAS